MIHIEENDKPLTKEQIKVLTKEPPVNKFLVGTSYEYKPTKIKVWGNKKEN